MRSRRLLLLIAVLLLLAIPVAAVQAGSLTSGNYTYLAEGRELMLSVDILPGRGGHLVPAELLTTFGIEVAEKGQSIRLTRGPVLVELEAGSATARVDGQRQYLTAAPARLAGRIFVPHSILPELALEITVDGKLVTIANYPPVGGPDPRPTDELLRLHSMSGYFRDGAALGQVTAVGLGYDLLAHEQLQLRWGLRQRLQYLLDDHTLIHFTVRNTSNRAIRFDPGQLYLVDSEGRQVEPLPEGEIPVTGKISQPTAPFARRSAVFLFPKVDAPFAYIYHNGSGEVLGRLNLR